MYWGWKRGCCSLYNCIKVIDHVILTTFKTVLWRFWLQNVFSESRFVSCTTGMLLNSSTHHWKCCTSVLNFCERFYMVLPWPQSFNCELCRWSAHLYSWLFIFLLHLTFRGQHMVATSFFFKHKLYTDTLWPLCIYTFVVYTFIFSCFIDFSVFFQ